MMAKMLDDNTMNGSVVTAKISGVTTGYICGLEHY